METISTILTIGVGLIALKALIIGSDFNFHSWLKDGKKYTEWYNNRPKYERR